VRVDPAGVRGELHQRGATGAGRVDRPLDQPSAQAVAAVVGPHPDGLDECPGRAEPGQSRDERELQRADDLTVRVGHRQHLPRVGVDLLERLRVARVARPFPLRAERVVGEHVDDVPDVLGAGLPDHHVRHEFIQTQRGPDYRG
jgi:hypothetical protein